MTEATLHTHTPHFANAAAQTPAGAREPLTPFTRLRGLLRPDRGDLLAVAAFAVASGVMLLATPIAVQALVNFVALGGAIPPLFVVAGLLFLGLGFAAVLGGMQAWTVEMLQRRLFVRMVADLAARLPRVRLSTYDARYGPDIVNRFFDIMTIQKAGSFLLLDGLSILLSVTVGLVVLAFYHPLLFAFDVVLLVIIAAVVLGPLRRGTRTAIAESKTKYAVVSWFEEVARNPLLFKAGGADLWVHTHADRLARNYLGKRAAHFSTLFRQIVGVLGLQVFASAALLGIGGFLVINGALTLGQLVAAEIIVTLVVSSVAKLGKHLESYYDLMAAVDKVGELLDLPVEDGGRELPARTSERGAAVRLHELSWTDDSGGASIEGLSLELKPGERVALRGPSGAGKDTLLELIWGLRRPKHGAVLLDDADLRELSPPQLRRDVALIGAPIDVVVGSLRDNVALGRERVSDADVRAALRRVGLDERVSLLSEGLDTPLRPSGQPLSSGETRRLLVARALAGAPRLLLVQDFLDHIDDETRPEILDALFDAPSGADAPTATDAPSPYTLLVVSNSPDVLARCDRVITIGELANTPAAREDDA